MIEPFKNVIFEMIEPHRDENFHGSHQITRSSVFKTNYISKLKIQYNRIYVLTIKLTNVTRCC